MAWYYRKFIRHFGSIAASLNQLLTKDGFKWNEDAEKAFQNLKITLTTPPILSSLDLSLLFAIECDASGVGIGAILS